MSDPKTPLTWVKFAALLDEIESAGMQSYVHVSQLTPRLLFEVRSGLEPSVRTLQLMIEATAWFEAHGATRQNLTLEALQLGSLVQTFGDPEPRIDLG